MPSIAHLILGGFFGLSLYFISDKKFSKTHVFILFLNNYLGPDVGWVIGLGRYSHTIVFWPIFALFLTFFYHYFTRFSLKIDGIKHIELIELDKHKLKYINTYFLVLAGGIMHIYLDSLINYGGIFRVIPEISNFNGINWYLEDFMKLWETGFLAINPVIALIIGVLFIFGFVFMFVGFLKFLSLKGFIMVLVYISSFIVLFFLLGSISTGEHSDVGAIIYAGLFLLSPLILCTLSIRDFKSIKEIRIKIFKSSNRKLFILSIMFILVGIIGFVLSVIGFVFNNILVKFIIENYGTDLPITIGEPEISLFTFLIELLIMILSIFNLTCAVGLFSKNKLLWKFTIYYQLAFSWTVIGLAIACALSENTIKEIFNPIE